MNSLRSQAKSLHSPRWSACLIGATLGMLGIVPIQAGEPQLVADLNVRGGGVQAMLAGADRLFFSTVDPDIGHEAWVSDGTLIGTRPLRDIAPGRRDGSPIFGATLGNRTWLSAFTAASGREPWVSDGSGAGTAFVADLRTGTDGSGVALGSEPRNYADLGDGTVVFLATGQAGVGLYRSNGTTSGTTLVKILDATLGNVSLTRGSVRIPGRAKAVVICNGKAWVSDGTTAGTVALTLPTVGGLDEVKEVIATTSGVFLGNSDYSGTKFVFTDGTQPGTRVIDAGGPYVFPRATTGSRLVFMGGRRLRSSDGTQAGTVIIRDVDAFYSISAANGTYVINTGGGNILTSDGTVGGTTQIGTGVFIFSNFDAVSAGGATWFIGSVSRNGKNDRQLWRIAGATLSEVKVLTAQPLTINDPDIGLRFDAALTAVGDTVFIRDRGKLLGLDAFTREVTVLSAGLNSGADGRVQGLRGFKNGFLFWVDHIGLPSAQADDKRPYFYAPGSTPIQLSTIRSPSDSGPNGLDSRGDFVVLGETALFPANNDRYFNPVQGMELWRTDGTPAGTALLKDVNPGSSGGIRMAHGLLPGNPPRVALTGGAVSTGDELLASDGTAAGTVLLKDINPGSAPSYPHVYTPMGPYALFSAITAAQGRELWRTDGTAAGTVLVKDIRAGSGSGMDRLYTDLRQPVRLGETAYFVADAGTTGWELWKSDGTAAGTVLVKDINPGLATSSVRDLTVFAGKLYFTANDGVHGREMWTSDGTTAGTSMVKDINPGSASACTALSADAFGYGLLTVSGGRLWLCANDGISGLELWSSDGTAAGTTLFRDIRPGSAGSDLHGLIDVAGVLCFSANDGISGRELWQCDGTQAGTFLAGDINTGAFDSNPFYRDPYDSLAGQQVDGSYLPDAVVLDGTVYFAARAESVGRELWSYTPSRGAQPGGIIAFAASAFTGSEVAGQALVTLTRSGGTGSVTVTVTTSGGTATSGADFTPFVGTVTFASGETSRTLSIAVAADGIVEGVESFGVTLSTPTGGAVLGLATTTVQISDGGAINQPPTATPLALATAIATPVQVNLTGSDPEGAVVTVSSVGAPTAGTLTGSGSSRTYTPPPGFSGTATFTFTVTDGLAVSAPATVTITVGSGGTAVPGDLNGSGTVTFEDLSLFLSSYGKSVGQAGFLAGANLNTAGSSATRVDFDDLAAFLALYRSR